MLGHRPVSRNSAPAQRRVTTLTSPYLDYDDHDAFRAAFDVWPCADCNEPGLDFIGPAKHPHYASLICRTCGYEHLNLFLPWPPRSKAEERRRRSKPLTVLDSDRCWYCDIGKDLAEQLGIRLERAHTVERADLIGAGLPPDEPDNLPLLCSECHAEQHRKREARRRYDALLTRALDE